MLKIYGRANSINVRKVLWTADETGIPYEREEWGRGFEPLTNPTFLGSMNWHSFPPWMMTASS